MNYFNFYFYWINITLQCRIHDLYRGIFLVGGFEFDAINTSCVVELQGYAMLGSPREFYYYYYLLIRELESTSNAFRDIVCRASERKLNPPSSTHHCTR